MKKNLDHLTSRKQTELRHVVEVIRTSFDEARACITVEDLTGLTERVEATDVA